MSNMTRKLERLKEGPKAEIYIVFFSTTQNKYQTGKRQSIMKYMDYGSRNVPLFMIDYHSK